MSDHWITPPEIIASLGGWRSFDLDPATPEVMPHRTARRRYTERDDGLFLPWFGRVWLNPPYSQPAIAHFLRRMALHNRGTALVFVRSDGSAWQEHVLRAASGLFFLLRKVKFFGVDGVRSKRGISRRRCWRPTGRRISTGWRRCRANAASWSCCGFRGRC